MTVGTDRCDHLDDPWRDGAVPVRFHEEEFSLVMLREAARRRPFAGVVAVGDRPAVLAARVAETLALPGNPPQAADASRNKRAMRQKFAAAGLAVPWFVELVAGADPEAAGSLRYPCVVKPLGLSGSRGVIRADTPGELRRAVERVRRLLARPAVRALRTGLDSTLLVEGFIPGREFAVEGLLSGGELQILAVFDKPDGLDGPFFEETIYVTPSSEPDDVQQEIARTIQRATTALGLRHGPVHAECRVGPDGVVVLEVAARPIGGLCSRVLRFRSHGEPVPLEEVLLRHASAEDVSSYRREDQAAGVMMIPIPDRGVFKSVAGLERARATPHVEDIRITAKRDQLLEPVPEGDSYLGFIFARARTPQAVVAALRRAHRQLEIRFSMAVQMA